MGAEWITGKERSRPAAKMRRRNSEQPFTRTTIENNQGEKYDNKV